jgi:F5/8 type C domain
MAQQDPDAGAVSITASPVEHDTARQTLSPAHVKRISIGCALIYVIVTLFLGRSVLAHLGSTITHDTGDPLLTAALLKWNATHVPLSQEWWQFPIFYPTRDTMAFSEHLLGLSAIASPIYWLTRDTLVTANIVTLLTFPLCAIAMYLLVLRLTGSTAGAFVAGLAFGFAPYRISQLPHVQMLASFWAPLALLGLHAFVDTGRKRWLALYGATWMLQGAANGYALVFFSLFIGLWVLWFVILRGKWAALVAIMLTTLVAALPLVAILYQYIVVHGRHGFARSLPEIQAFSADVSAVLCAPSDLMFWGWLRVMCRGEGELFPGVAVFALWLFACVRGLGRFGAASPSTGSTWMRIAVRLVFGVGLLYAAIVASVLLFGPWRVNWGFIHASVSSVRKPALVATMSLVIALMLSPFARGGAKRFSTLGFYLLASIVTWLLTLGPQISFMGVPSGYAGPFAWLLALPGSTGLRVPARFWLMTVLCLSVVAGIVLAELLRTRLREKVTLATVVAAFAVLADGWVVGIPAAAAPGPVPGDELMRRAVVMELPPDASFRDTTAVFRAVEGGWRTVNGYSGWQPNYYFALVGAARGESPDTFTPFVRLGELRVLVQNDAARLQQIVEQQPGATLVARNAELSQYRLPGRTLEDPAVAGQRRTIKELRSECSSLYVRVVDDRDQQTLWQCALTDDRQPLIVDLGAVSTVGAVVHSIGTQFWLYPSKVSIETSEDGATWALARSGSVLHEVMVAGLRDPGLLRIVLPFPARQARYLRLRGSAGEPQFPWTVAELEVWSEGRGIR